MAGTNVSFDGNSLQTANIFTSNIQHELKPNKSMQMYALAHATGSKIPYVQYTSKDIKLMGTIYGSSIADLDSRLDAFRGSLTKKDGNLDIDYNGSTRRYICTVNAVGIDRPGGLTYATFEIDLIATSSFGQDTGTTSLVSASARTAASYTDTPTFAGSAPFQQPIATITINSLTGGAAKVVTFGNNATGQQCTITRNWTAGDILVIDSTTKIVTVNGIEVEYVGAVPEFAPGASSIAYSDTFTTRNVNYSVVYYKRYL